MYACRPVRPEVGVSHVNLKFILPTFFRFLREEILSERYVSMRIFVWYINRCHALNFTNISNDWVDHRGIWEIERYFRRNFVSWYSINWEIAYLHNQRVSNVAKTSVWSWINPRWINQQGFVSLIMIMNQRIKWESASFIKVHVALRTSL